MDIDPLAKTPPSFFFQNWYAVFKKIDFFDEEKQMDGRIIHNCNIMDQSEIFIP